VPQVSSFETWILSFWWRPVWIRESGFSSWFHFNDCRYQAWNGVQSAREDDGRSYSERWGLKDDEVIFGIIESKKHIVPVLFLWHSLCFTGSSQPGILVGSKWLASGTEDSSRRDGFEETLRNLREYLRYIDLVPGGEWPTEHSEARSSQRETLATQTPFAQHPYRGRSGRWCGCRNRRSAPQTVLIAKLLFGYWRSRPTGWNRRGARWRGGRRRRNSFALSQYDLPGELALVCLGSSHAAPKSRISISAPTPQAMHGAQPTVLVAKPVTSGPKESA
jgi:hypothetical protein